MKKAKVDLLPPQYKGWHPYLVVHVSEVCVTDAERLFGNQSPYVVFLILVSAECQHGGLSIALYCYQYGD